MIGRGWRAWRHWRRSRPFWGGLLILLAGAEILVTERLPLRVILHLGPQGVAGYLLPVVMVLCGLLLWFNPTQRVFYAILAILISLGTWITSNLGGFIFGLVLGLVGGSLAFAWTPRPAAPASPTAAEGARSPHT
jgi:Family of unknown function (DUF6114)